jgi:1-acyl-sn-glycerol-3-phosphate acyltransferase
MKEKYYCRKHLEKDFVRKELKLFSPFAEIIAFILEFISIALMNYVKAIPVYKNSKRIIETLNLSLDFLKSNKNIIIFPEQESNSVDYQIVQEFQTGFIKLSKIYYEKTGKKVPLVPISINKKCNFIKIGKIIYFNPKNNFLEEKKRILNHLRNEIIKNIEN